jgi:hypothetical protein
MSTFRFFALVAVLVAALVVVSPAGATCFGDSCDQDPITEPDPTFGTVPVNVPHTGVVDFDWVSFQDGVPNGVGLTGWSTSSLVRVTINGFWVMNVPSRDTSPYMSHSGLRFTVSLPVYPWPADREVCVDAIDSLWARDGKRLGCRSSFTWWL